MRSTRIGVLTASASILLSQLFVLPAGANGPLVCGVDLSTTFTVDSEDEPVVAMSESGKLIYATSVLTPGGLGGPSTVRTTVTIQGGASFTVPGLVRLKPGPDGIIWMKHRNSPDGAITEQGILHYSPSTGVRKSDNTFQTAFYDVMPDGRALVVPNAFDEASPPSLLSSDGSMVELPTPPVTGSPQSHGAFYSAEAALVRETYLVSIPATPTQPASSETVVEQRLWRNGQLTNVTELGGVVLMGGDLLHIDQDSVQVFDGLQQTQDFLLDSDFSVKVIESGASGWVAATYVGDGGTRIAHLGRDGVITELGTVDDVGGQLNLASDGVNNTWVVLEVDENHWSISRLLDAAHSPQVPSSSELGDQVSRLYLAYFLREPEAAGLNFWLGERAAGATLASVSQLFAQSPEFLNQYGSLSDTEFVHLVYQNVLDRAPDPGGLDHWVGQLQVGDSRGSVMIGFSESDEFRAQTGTSEASAQAESQVYRLYRAYFLRQPDQSGMCFWTQKRQLGLGLDAISEAFAQSPEFQGRYGALADEQFVTLVYENVLGRTPDQDGLAHWTGQLQAGVSRGSVMVGFSESAEYRIATGTLP